MYLALEGRRMETGAAVVVVVVEGGGGGGEGATAAATGLTRTSVSASSS